MNAIAQAAARLNNQETPMTDLDREEQALIEALAKIRERKTFAADLCAIEKRLQDAKDVLAKAQDEVQYILIERDELRKKMGLSAPVVKIGASLEPRKYRHTTPEDCKKALENPVYRAGRVSLLGTANKHNLPYSTLKAYAANQ